MTAEILDKTEYHAIKKERKNTKNLSNKNRRKMYARVVKILQLKSHLIYNIPIPLSRW
jgi:hypothetical protein